MRVSFTPHLMPMSRGMQSTIYVRLDGGASVDDLRASLQARHISAPRLRPCCLLCFFSAFWVQTALVQTC